MGTFLSRLLALVLATAALFFGVRALIFFWVLTSGPTNFIPRAKVDVPTQATLSGETEQVLIVLVSSIVIALAWMVWSKSKPRAN
jgi:ABC-type glucose/galactose transport system permease subunit